MLFRRDRRYFTSGIFLVLLFSRCAGLFTTGEGLTRLTPEQLAYRIDRHASRLETFQGYARLSVVSAGGAFRGGIRISMKQPDSLWIKVEGPLGIDMVTGCFGAGLVRFYSPWMHTQYVGSVQQFLESNLLPFRFETDDLIRGITGIVVPAREILDSVAVVSVDEGKYVLDLAGNERFWIDPKGPVVSRWEKTNGEGDLLWSWEGREFVRKKGLRFPVVVEFQNHQDKQRAILFYENISTNRPLREGWCHIKIPEGVETIAL